MASPNSTYTELVTTTLAGRSRRIQDNVTANNAILFALSKKGRIRPFSGGRTIVEEISYAENGNAQWYSGYETLSVTDSQVLTAAEFAIKQLAVPVVMSGLEMIQNSGKEAMLDLMESRIRVAEDTMKNYIDEGLAGDGTAYSSKTLTGLLAAAPADPTTGTYGGINRATSGNEFWRSTFDGTTTTAGSVQLGVWNSIFAALTRGSDKPDLIVAGTTEWKKYLAGIQTNQRFANTALADAGFATLKFMTADVVLGGGIGGNQTAAYTHFLNTNYLHFRPHRDRNMVALPGKRTAVNQDAEVSLLVFAGNLTCSGAQFLGLSDGA